MTRPQLAATDRPRLHAQCRRIMAFYLQYPGWWTLGEIARGIGAASEAGISARLRELANPKKPYQWAKDKRIRRGSLREYRMTPPGEPSQLSIL